MDEEAIKDRMRQHAAAASEIGKRALRYFPDVYHEKFQNVAATERSYITNLLNEMISNRNRKLQGIGKVDDMLKRCHIDKTPAYFQAIAVNY